MGTRISELPQVFQANPGDLLELAIVNEESPSGYSSHQIEVSDLLAGQGLTNRFLFSGTVTLDEFVSWQFSIPYTDLQYLIPSGPYSINTCGAASLDMSLSVFQDLGSGGGRYGSTTANIMYSTDDGKYINYFSTSGISTAGTPVTLPHFPPTYTGLSIPPIITNVLFDELTSELVFTVSIATDVYSTPPSGDVTYRGYVDITMTPYIYGT